MKLGDGAIMHAASCGRTKQHPHLRCLQLSLELDHGTDLVLQLGGSLFGLRLCNILQYQPGTPVRLCRIFKTSIE